MADLFLVVAQTSLDLFGESGEEGRRSETSGKACGFLIMFRQFYSVSNEWRYFSYPKHINCNSLFLQVHQIVCFAVCLGVSLFIVEATAGGVTILDRIEGVESPRGLPLYDVTFNNVILSKSQLLGKSEYACIYGRCDGRNDAS